MDRSYEDILTDFEFLDEQKKMIQKVGEMDRVEMVVKIKTWFNTEEVEVIEEHDNGVFRFLFVDDEFGTEIQIVSNLETESVFVVIEGDEHDIEFKDLRSANVFVNGYHNSLE
jgi:methyl coenzyme M reductase subunit C-like uncharacterized protein (methanogenesis marker protein 7)